MYHLLEDRRTVQRGAVMVPELSYITNGMRRNLNRFTMYYQQEPRAVKSQHFLVRLIQSIHVSLSNDVFFYRQLVSEITNEVARSVGITTPLYRGKIRRGVLFQNVNESYIATNEPFDIDSDWRSWSPLKIHAHPFDTITPTPMNGAGIGTNEDFAVVSINIPMLAAQYRQWHYEERQVSIDESPRSVMQFVSMYPLTNILESFIDISMFNRLSKIHSERSFREIEVSNPFLLNDYRPAFDKAVGKLVEQLERKTLPYSALVQQIPNISDSSAFDVFELPKTTMTRQDEWVFMVSRLPLVKYLLSMNFVTGNRNNRQGNNHIKRILRQAKSDRIIQQSLPRQLSEIVIEDINEYVVPYVQ